MKIVDIFLSNIVLFITVLCGLYYLYIPFGYSPKVVFLDVGQGDSILLLDESGKKILIDGGDGDYVVYKIGKYFHPRDRVIDIVILTHPHQDHLSGLIDIIERYDVKKVFYYPACYGSQMYKYFLNMDFDIHYIEQGVLFSGESFVLEVLYPFEDYDKVECLDYKNVNNASIIIKMESDSGSMLFMGDAEHEQEERILAYYKRKPSILEADVLKAGHHCSKTATSERFLNRVKPSYVLCCVGEDNKFGHPHFEVIDLLTTYGIKYDLLFETGDIVFNL